MKAPSLLLALAAAAVIAVVAVIGYAFKPDANPTTAHSLRPDDARMLATGERGYMAQCASCHGARLEGQPERRARGADGVLPAPAHDGTGRAMSFLGKPPSSTHARPAT